MTRSETLGSVARLAGDREQQAAVRLAEAQAALDARLVRLEELERYRRDYVAGVSQGAAGAMGGLRETRLFIARLQQAIGQQEALVKQARGQLELARAQWLAQRRHAEALSKVMADARLEEQRERLLADQRELDEIASRSAALKHTG